MTHVHETKEGIYQSRDLVILFKNLLFNNTNLNLGANNRKDLQKIEENDFDKNNQKPSNSNKKSKTLDYSDIDIDMDNSKSQIIQSKKSKSNFFL